MTAADRESGRGGMVGIVDGAVIAFDVAGRDTPVVVAMGAATAAAVVAPVAPARSHGFGGDAITPSFYARLGCNERSGR